MRQMATMSNLDVWYSKVEIEGLVEALKQHAATSGSKAEAHMAATATKTTEKALTKDSMRALNKLTRVVDGERRIVSEPPLIVPIDELFPGAQTEEHLGLFREVIRKYRQSLPTDRRHLLEQYKFSQLARKVVGVGSVGTRCWIILMHGPRHEDVLFLQAKEAEASVFERFTKKSSYGNHGARVVAGQRLMQASSDILLGWQRSVGLDGVSRDYYVRQLQDWKGSIDTENAIPEGLKVYRSSAPTRWPGPTRARATGSPSRRTSATTRRSRRRWPASPSPTPTRTSGTTRRSPPPARAAGSTPKKESEAGLGSRTRIGFRRTNHDLLPYCTSGCAAMVTE